MSDVSPEEQRLREEAQAIDDEFRAAWISQVQTAQLAIGPFLMRRVIGSQGIARVYVIFNALCFVAGLILAPMGGALDTIGVSLIVGALFSFGAFVSQFWAFQAQKEYNARMALGGEAQLKELLNRRDEVDRHLQELEQEKAPKRAKPE